MAKRVIVVSDSHGAEADLRAALDQAVRHGPMDAVVFLGDGMADFERLQPWLLARGTVFYAVKGNNDWSSGEMTEIVFTVNGVRFFACHGHTRYVKYGTDRLWYAAREREAKVVLYGHTHCENVEDAYGITMINPGAVCERYKRRSAYAEVLVEDNGFVQACLVKWE